MKLTHAQSVAFAQLSAAWKSAYAMRASMSTLNALVKKGLAECTGYGVPGAIFSPRTMILYRAAQHGIKPTGAPSATPDNE